ncbi:uncharacterized protein J3D65DRAFT_620810, partial [Phyllosticta citribraziliensis]
MWKQSGYTSWQYGNPAFVADPSPCIYGTALFLTPDVLRGGGTPRPSYVSILQAPQILPRRNRDVITVVDRRGRAGSPSFVISSVNVAVQSPCLSRHFLSPLSGNNSWPLGRIVIDQGAISPLGRISFVQGRASMHAVTVPVRLYLSFRNAAASTSRWASL